MVDFEQEITKLDAKMDKVKAQLDSWATKKASPGYAKVREDVKEANEIKIKGLEAEMDALLAAKTNFLNLRDA